MINIGICDDIPELCELLYNQITNGNYTSIPINISIYHNTRELINASPKPDVLFLDIEMPEMTGMELMQQYGTLFTNTKVIFLTSHSEYVYDGYKVNAYRFCPKPISDGDLRELFETLEKEQILYKTIRVHTQQTAVSIYLKDIIYIEAFKNGSYIITSTDKWQTTMRIKDIIKELPANYFYQPHKSFIVNMTQIQQPLLKEYMLRMSDNSFIDIAKHKRKDFTEFYSKFLLHS